MIEGDNTTVVDATKKNCKGVIAALENTINTQNPDFEIDVLLLGIPNRLDVYAWAKKRGFIIRNEHREGALFKLTVASSNTN